MISTNGDVITIQTIHHIERLQEGCIDICIGGTGFKMVGDHTWIVLINSLIFATSSCFSKVVGDYKFAIGYGNYIYLLVLSFFIVGIAFLFLYINGIPTSLCIDIVAGIRDGVGLVIDFQTGLRCLFHHPNFWIGSIDKFRLIVIGIRRGNSIPLMNKMIFCRDGNATEV